MRSRFCSLESFFLLLRYVDGDYSDPDPPFARCKELKETPAPAPLLAIAHMFEPVSSNWSTGGCTTGARIVIESHSGMTSIGEHLNKFFSESSMRAQFSGSTTTWVSAGE